MSVYPLSLTPPPQPHPHLPFPRLTPLHNKHIPTRPPPPNLIRHMHRIQHHQRIILRTRTRPVAQIRRQIIATRAGDVEVGDAGAAGVVQAGVAALVGVAEGDGVGVEGFFVAGAVVVVLDRGDAGVGDVGCAGSGEGGEGGYEF